MNFWNILINLTIFLTCCYIVSDIISEKDFGPQVTQHMVAFLFIRGLAQRDGYNDIKGEA